MNVIETAADMSLLLALLHGAWWTVLSTAAMVRPQPEATRSERLQLVVIVPAHNEESLIEACLRSLQAADTAAAREVIVVADNCTDRTAAVARLAGTTVLERHDATRRGKSFALDYALQQLAARPQHPDAVLFVDADTTVSSTFYTAIERRLADGALAVQVHYEAARGETALGRLRRIAFLLIHWSRPLGASRLGLGTTLKGNGMALRWDVVARGFAGAGLAEDADMTLRLVRQGIPVTFEPVASVTGYMAQRYAAARTQDDRWERGRFALMPRALALAVGALARGDVAAAAGALEVASLPLSLVVALTFGGGVLAIAGQGSIVLAFAAAASVGCYLVVGAAAARVPLSELTSLSAVPRYLWHKARVYARVLARPAGGWERTRRS